jgi:hypothetical protein
MKNIKAQAIKASDREISHSVQPNESAGCFGLPEWS